MKYFLKFTINNKDFAVPIEEIVEIARPKTIQTQKDKNIVGTFSLRRETIYVVDLASILRIKGGKKNEIMIVNIEGDRVGFCVDRISGIIELEQVSPVPDLIKSHRSLTGMLTMKETIIPVISLARTLNKASLSAIRNKRQSKNKK